jgi:glucose uptake protein GlcU
MSVGYVAAGLAAVFNGSFTSPYKIERVAKLNLHPILFTLYVCCGVFLSSLLVIPFLDQNEKIVDDDEAGTSIVFSYFGVIAGLLLVVALAASFLAIDCIGVALSQGVFGGTAIFVSYIWGVVIFNQPPSNAGLSAFGVIMLITGVVIIAFNRNILQFFETQLQRSEAESSIALSLFPNVDSTHLISNINAIVSTDKWFAGISWALLVGLSGGSILAPLNYVPPKEAGFAFVLSFGIGAIIGSPLLAIIWFIIEKKVPPLHLQEALPAGLFSGLLWNISNVLAIVAIPQIGYAVAYPILQCALFVAGMWGIFVFKEIEGKQIYIFFGGGIILISGAVCVSLAS